MEWHQLFLLCWSAFASGVGGAWFFAMSNRKWSGYDFCKVTVTSAMFGAALCWILCWWFCVDAAGERFVIGLCWIGALMGLYKPATMRKLAEKFLPSFMKGYKDEFPQQCSSWPNDPPSD